MNLELAASSGLPVLHIGTTPALRTFSGISFWDHQWLSRASNLHLLGGFNHVYSSIMIMSGPGCLPTFIVLTPSAKSSMVNGASSQVSPIVTITGLSLIVTITGWGVHLKDSLTESF